MRDLPLNTLRAFAAVYETGGIRPAGRRLNVTHSSISRHIRELEAWVGAPLFIKKDGRRSLQFSPQGEVLGKSVLRSLGEINTAVSAVRESRQANSVTISTTPSFAARWLLQRLPGFEARYPGIEVSVLVEQQLKPPHEEGADIAIRMGSGPWPDLVCHQLMDDSVFPVMSPSYWEKSGNPQTIEDLVRLRLLHDRDHNASWASWKKACGPAHLDTRKGPRFTSSDLVLRAAESGMGVALARERLVFDDLQAGRLIRPMGSSAIKLDNAYWIVHEHHLTAREVVGLAIEWLLKEVDRTDASILQP